MRAADPDRRLVGLVLLLMLSLAATLARAAVYFVLPSLAPADNAPWRLLLLVLLRAALTSLTEGWRLPAEPAAASSAPWALPAPKAKAQSTFFLTMLLCLAPACYLACCGRLLTDPLLPLFCQVFLWLFAVAHLALCAGTVMFVHDHDDLAHCNPAGLVDMYTPLGSLLSCVRLPAQARVLRATPAPASRV